MGRVYKVFDAKIGEKIALKIIRPEAVFDNTTVERFANELKLARKIRHKNICQMYDLGEDQGTHYIAMEYVHGEDLKQIIRKMGRLSPSQAVGIALQVGNGLAEAHKLGVVHRDLKPQNIMLDEDGNARIMDFGIARSLSGKGITGAGAMIGTPEYMSPEQVEGKDTDQRSDIYSLGVILYEMVTGRVPFEGDSAFTIGAKHKSEPPKDPRSFNADLPENLSRVILRCLEKDKEKRYASTIGLCAELDKIGQGVPIAERVVPVRKTSTSHEITVKFAPQKLLIPALSVVALIVAAIIFWPKKAPLLDPNLVAVAVFSNQTGDPKLDSLGREAAQWITEGLTQANLFAVAPLPSAEALQGQDKIKDPLRKLAIETGAGKIVVGSYHLQGDTIRFFADIRDMNSGKILQAIAPVDGPRQEPNRPLEYLRTKLMGAVACLFTPMIKSFLLAMSEAPNFESYRETLAGMKSFVRYEHPKAIEHYNQAVAFDPSNRFASICSGFVLFNQEKYTESQALVDEIKKSSEKLSSGEILLLDLLQAWLSGNLDERHRLIKQFIALTNGDAYWNYELVLEAHNDNYLHEAVEAFKKMPLEDEMWKNWGQQWGVATSAYHILGEFKNELKEARRARKERPESLSRLWLEVRALCGMGRMKDINRLLDESSALPPQGGYSRGRIMYLAGRDLRAHGFKKESFQVLERARQWYEGRPQEEILSAANRYSQGMIFVYLERWKEAQDLFVALQKEFPANTEYLSACGQLAAITGNREKAQSISNQLGEIKTPYLFGSVNYARALIASSLGDKESSVKLLRQAIGEGYPYPYAHGSMAWEKLKDYPPYVQLMKPKD